MKNLFFPALAAFLAITIYAADELVIGSYEINLDNGSLTHNQDIPRQTIDQATARRFVNTVQIGTGSTALATGAVSTIGWTHWKNLETTNTVLIGFEVLGTFYASAEVKPGEEFTLRWSTNAPYAKAPSNTVELDYLLLQN